MLKLLTKFTGRSFAVLLKDGSCRVYNTDNGKLLFNLQHPQTEHEWTAITWNQLQFSDVILSLLPFKNVIKLDTVKHIPKLPSIQGPASEYVFTFNKQNVIANFFFFLEIAILFKELLWKK